MSIALLTTYLSDYRLPLYRLLADRHDVEVLCYGGGERYAAGWFADLDAQLTAAAFPARRLDGLGEALRVGRHHRAVVAPFAGGALLPAAYAGARRYRRPFVFWASIWHQPRSVAHALALPVTRHIYRHADAVVAYGEHARRFVARTRGRDDDIFIAPQAVEPELFARAVSAGEVAAFRAAHELGDGPLVLYAGRLAAHKGVDVLARAWPRVGGEAPLGGAESTLGSAGTAVGGAAAPLGGAAGPLGGAAGPLGGAESPFRSAEATLVVAGDGPLAGDLAGLPRTRLLGPVPRAQLPVAYAAAEFTVVPSVPTPRFKEPWGLVCNESMHQARPVIATTAVGAAAGGLVRHGQTGLVVPAGDADALAEAISCLLRHPPVRSQLGQSARQAVAGYTYEAMADAFDRAFAAAGIS